MCFKPPFLNLQNVTVKVNSKIYIVLASFCTWVRISWKCASVHLRTWFNIHGLRRVKKLVKTHYLTNIRPLIFLNHVYLTTNWGTPKFYLIMF